LASKEKGDKSTVASAATFVLNESANPVFYGMLNPY
jgi:hypothetical protein